MNPPENLSTDRLILRRAGLGDSEALFEALSDVEVTRYISEARLTDPAQAAALVEKMEEVWLSGTNYNWAITLRAGGAVVGFVGVHTSDSGLELGFVLLRSTWGHGFATEAVGAVIDWAFSESDVFRVWGLATTENATSQRVLEKLGMVQEGRLHRALPIPNTSEVPADAFIYAKWR